MRALPRRALALLLAAGGCGFDRAGGAADLGGSDGGAAICRTLPLPCLALAPGVIAVPDQATVADAFARAKSGDTIQIRGLSLGAGLTVPAGVTLHGCMGAQISDTIRFAGGSGAVEGFEVPGAVIADQSGSYTIRANRFVAGGTTTAAGVSARANDPTNAASVTAVVEGNWFQLRDLGAEAFTDNGPVQTVSLTVRNNIFYGVTRAITADQLAAQGGIDVQISFNTVLSCGTGVVLEGLANPTPIVATLFYLGGQAVDAASPYTVDHTYVYAVLSTPPLGQPPQAGMFQIVDPMLADWAHDDLHLAPGSPLIDVVPIAPGLPADDYFGCPRPAGDGADVGAIENQQ